MANITFYKGTGTAKTDDGALSFNTMENVIYLGNGTTADPIANYITYATATTSANGLMSSSDKSKLDNIASGANNYSLPVATSSTLGGVKSGTDITIDSSGNVSVNDDSHNHVISNIDGLQDELDGKASMNNVNAHTQDTSNPHSVTKDQVGLSNVANERQYSESNPPPSKETPIRVTPCTNYINWVDTESDEENEEINFFTGVNLNIGSYPNEYSSIKIALDSGDSQDTQIGGLRPTASDLKSPGIYISYTHYDTNGILKEYQAVLKHVVAIDGTVSLALSDTSEVDMSEINSSEYCTNLKTLL